MPFSDASASSRVVFNIRDEGQQTVKAQKEGSSEAGPMSGWWQGGAGWAS